VLVYKKGQNLLNLLLRLIKVSYLVVIQTLTYYVFNVTTSCVETTCDAVFDETNDSQKEQVNLDLVDDEKTPYDALQRMAMDDVMPQDPSNQAQETSPNDTTPA
jgi:uncharacterized membrane protein